MNPRLADILIDAHPLPAYDRRVAEVDLLLEIRVEEGQMCVRRMVIVVVEADLLRRGLLGLQCRIAAVDFARDVEVHVHGGGLEHRRCLVARCNAALHRKVAVRHIDEVAARTEIVVVVLGMIVAQTVGKDELLRDRPRILTVERPVRARDAAVVVGAALLHQIAEHHLHRRRQHREIGRLQPAHQMIVHALPLPASAHSQCMRVAEIRDVLRIVGNEIIFDAVADRRFDRNKEVRDRGGICRACQIRIEVHLVAQEGERIRPRPMRSDLVFRAEHNLGTVKALRQIAEEIRPHERIRDWRRHPPPLCKFPIAHILRTVHIDVVAVPCGGRIGEARPEIPVIVVAPLLVHAERRCTALEVAAAHLQPYLVLRDGTCEVEVVLHRIRLAVRRLKDTADGDSAVEFIRHLLRDDVDHAAHRIRPVEGRHGAAHHLDAFNLGGRGQARIRELVKAAHHAARDAGSHLRHPVHEDQRIAVTHAANRDRRRIESPRRTEGIDALHRVEHLTQISVAALCDLLRMDHGDTRRRIAHILLKARCRHHNRSRLIAFLLCLHIPCINRVPCTRKCERDRRRKSALLCHPHTIPPHT